jgi:tetratricopeptide (TPR) repeat protein
VAARGREAGIGELDIRIAIATGNVVARGDRSGELHIAGDVIPMVRRICALAPRGRILLDDRTRRRLLHVFDVRPLAPGPAIFDGHPPQNLFVVDCEIGTGRRIDSIADARLTPFQGRDEELGLLRRELRHAQSGSGRLVVVEGDAGLGKSRLVYEFSRTLADSDTRFVSVRCHAHGTGTPYRPLAEALRVLLSLPADTGADASGRDHARQQLLDLDGSLEIYLPLLLQVLGNPGGRFAGSEQVDEPEFRTMAAEAIATTLTLAARQRSIVLVVEDVHWADAASLGALVRLNELIGTSSLLAVLTSRPGPHVDRLRADPGIRLRLDPLVGPAARAVAASALRSDEVHPDLAEQIEVRAGGNPFFIEELCAAFIEEDAARVVNGRAILIRNADELPTPDSVHALLTGRLDRLPLAERRMVRIASVIGSEFRRSVLETVWDGTESFAATLEAIRNSGMIQKATLMPEPLFRFRHALIRDVAYAGLLDHQRRDLHRRVGETLEASTCGADSAGVLAAHFANAEQWAKAIRYARAAGEAAAALKEPLETLRNLETAYEWCSRLEPDERRPIQVELLLEREKFYEIVGDRLRQAQMIDEVLALIPEGENSRDRAEAFRRRCDLEALCGRHEQALGAIQEADRLCVLAGDARLELRVLRSRTHLHWRNSEFERAQELAEQLVERVRNVEDHRTLIMDLQNLASIVSRNGDLERARLILEEEVRPMAERSDRPLDRINLLYQLGKVYSLMGFVEPALACHREVAAMPEMRTLPEEHGYQHLAISGLLLSLDRIVEAIDAAREAVRLMRRVKHADSHAHASRNLAELLVNVGRPDEALPELDEALDLFERIQDQPMVYRLRLLRARTLELAGNQTDALEEWGRIRAEAHSERDITNEILALEAMSRCSETSDPASASQLAGDALELAERAGVRPAAARLSNRLAVLAWRRHEFDVTIEYYERAANIYRTLGDSRSLAVVLNGLGATRRQSGFLRPARDALDEAIRISREHAASEDLANGLAALGALLDESGDPSGGRAALEEALQIRRALGQAVECGWTLLKLARIAPSTGAQTRDPWLSEASRIARDHGNAELLRACGEVAVL